MGLNFKSTRLESQDAIPKSKETSIDTSQSSSIVMSPPTIPRVRSIMRVNSLENSLHREGLTSATSVGSLKRNVSFGNVRIRDYERVACDNPSVSQGVPIGLGWSFVDCGKVHVDQYERHHEKRSKTEMLMPATERMNLLVKEWEVNQKDIIQCIRRSNRVKHQRRQTIINDQDAVMIQLRQVFKVLKRCIKPISKVLKRNENKKTSPPSWCSEGTTDSLDKTRHRGTTLVEMEKIVENASEATEAHKIEEISIQHA